MARVTPEQFSDRWATNLKAQRTQIQDSVNRVTENPMEKAAQKEDKMLQNITDAIQSGRWAAGLRRVTLAQWKSAMIEVGIPRIVQGVDKNKGKVTSFGKALLDYQDSYLSSVHDMPDLTLDDNEQRMIANMRAMSNFRYK